MCEGREGGECIWQTYYIKEFWGVMVTVMVTVMVMVMVMIMVIV